MVYLLFLQKLCHHVIATFPSHYLNLTVKDNTAQNMKFCIKYFFSNCDQIRRKLRIWSHLLKKSLMENFIFYAVQVLSPMSLRFVKIVIYELPSIVLTLDVCRINANVSTLTSTLTHTVHLLVDDC